MKWNKSSKLCILPKQEQFPPCSCGSNPSKQIQKSGWGGRDEKGQDKICCYSQQQEAVTAILLPALTPLPHPWAAGKVLPGSASLWALWLWADESMLSPATAHHSCQGTLRTWPSHKTAAWHFPRHLTAPKAHPTRSSCTPQQIPPCRDFPSLWCFTPFLFFFFFFPPQKAVSCFMRTLESGWVNGRGKNKDMRI